MPVGVWAQTDHHFLNSHTRVRTTLKHGSESRYPLYEAGYEYEHQLPRISNSAEALGSSTALTGDTDGHTSNVPLILQVVDYIVFGSLSVRFPDA